MSGALTELVAKGAQDAYLTGNPEVSFFHQAYKRHTNFAQKPVQVDYTGTAGNNQQINLKLLNKGDLLGYIWMDMTNIGSTVVSQLNTTIFELYIGGQLVDRQDGFYMTNLWQKFLVDSSAKGFATNPLPDDSDVQGDYANAKWLPLHFFFCDSMCYLPLVALQYHEVEVRITFGNSGITFSSPPTFYANYIVLDTTEREAIVKKEHNLLIEQVQRIVANSPGTTNGANKFDLSYLNHPVKCLLWGDANQGTLFSSNTVQLYLNGTEVFGSPMPDVFFTQVQGYYHSEFASELLKGYGNLNGGNDLKMYSFALKANKHQPCGTCNFSRLDNAALTFNQLNAPTDFYLYAVNFNIFRIKNGLGGLAFSS